MGHANSRARVPAMSVPLHPGFGVLVMKPYRAEPLSSSTGPKEPTPIAARLPNSRPRRKKAQVAAKVEAGSAVGKRSCARISPRSLPMATTNLVPPASTQPKTRGTPVMGRKHSASAPANSSSNGACGDDSRSRARVGDFREKILGSWPPRQVGIALAAGILQLQRFVHIVFLQQQRDRACR